MPKAQPVVSYPSLRSLSTVKGCRTALARLFLETKRGLIDPQLASRLAHMASLLIGSARDHGFEVRLAELEQKLAEAEAVPPRPRANGHRRAERCQ